MDVVPIVADEIVSRYHHQCTTKDGVEAAVTPELTALLTRLWLVGNPNVDAVGHVAESVASIEKLTEEITQYLLKRCTIASMAALALQTQYSGFQKKAEAALRKAAVQREAITMKLMDTLLAKEPGTMVEDVWGAIAMYSIHHYTFGVDSGSGSASGIASPGTAAAGNATVQRETITAVSSALPRSQVPPFLQQESLERQGQLTQLRRIVWGIRLYNKADGRSSGPDLKNLSASLEEPLAALESQAATAIAELQDQLRRTSALLLSPSCPLSKTEQQQLQAEYHHLLLVEHIMRISQCGMRRTRQRSENDGAGVFHRVVEELRGLLNPDHRISTSSSAPSSSVSAAPTRREAAPKSTIFPKFMELSDAYEVALHCIADLGRSSELLQLATSSAASYPSFLPQSAADAAYRQTVEVQRMTPQITPGSIAAEVESLLRSETTKKKLPPGVLVTYQPTQLRYGADPVVVELYPESICAMRGFCPVHFLSRTNGLLIRGRLPNDGKPNSSAFGFLEVSGGDGLDALRRPLLFAFADAASIRAFAADPWYYVRGCLRVCHQNEPVVSVVMGIPEEELPGELYLDGAREVEKVAASSCGAYSTAIVQSAAAVATEVDSATPASRAAAVILTSDAPSGPPVKGHAGTQTGQIDPHVDHCYYWNEWDLRRHALRLANLLHMRTHSTQTAASHYRRDATTQVYPPRASATQTMMEAATQPIHVMQYLRGLRGTETSAIDQVQAALQF